MLSIIGNIKIDESNPKLVSDLFICLSSIGPVFHSIGGKVVLNIEDASDSLMSRVMNVPWVQWSVAASNITRYGSPAYSSYGEIYCKLLNRTSQPFIFNLESDHMVVNPEINKLYELDALLKKAAELNVSVIKSSFHKIENKSCDGVADLIYSDEYCRVFEMSVENYVNFCKAYPRYYVGTNCIFERSYALRLFSRSFNSMRPHEYELSGYVEEFKHRVMIPRFEILCPLSDDHGEVGSCVESRNLPYYQQLKQSTNFL